jgi:hypothetical protein
METNNKIKHLEFLQLTITRMNVNSFMLKGWLVTIVGAVFALSQKDAKTAFIWFAPFATLIFYFLDAYYLSLERQFRSLYDHVRALKEEEINFSMDVSNFQTGQNDYFSCLFSLTLLMFYIIIFLASLVAAIYINH